MATATKNTAQEYDPRHRLTGAVVLILLAIVLLPMLLGKKTEPVSSVPDAKEAVVMEVTKEGKKVFVSRISSVVDKSTSDEPVVSSLISPISPVKSAQTKAKTKSEPKKKSQTAVVKNAPAKTQAAKKSPSSPKSKSSSKDSNKSSAAKSGDWILQVGVFSQAANANKKVAELKKKGFSAVSGKVKTSKGTATKVWIGPYKDRKAAEKMQDRLLHKTRQRGIVVKMKP